MILGTSGEKQVVTKTGFSTADLDQIFVSYHQYYYVQQFDYWFEFLQVTVDLCKVRPPLQHQQCKTASCQPASPATLCL